MEEVCAKLQNVFSSLVGKLEAKGDVHQQCIQFIKDARDSKEFGYCDLGRDGMLESHRQHSK